MDTGDIGCRMASMEDYRIFLRPPLWLPVVIATLLGLGYIGGKFVYDWTEQGQIFRGFEASQSFRVKVRDLAKVDDVLTVATDAGANQAGNVQFTIDDPEKQRADAREEAVAEAKRKAELLARNLGKRLGRLKGFSEGGGGWVQPMMMRVEKVVMSGGAPDLPLPAGEQEINVQVTLTYELK